LKAACEWIPAAETSKCVLRASWSLDFSASPSRALKKRSPGLPFYPPGAGTRAIWAEPSRPATKREWVDLAGGNDSADSTSETSEEQHMSAQTRMQKIQALLAQEPKDPELHYMLAMEHVSQGDDADAASCFEKLIALAPEYIPAYHMAGRTLQRLGRIDEARAVLQKGIPIALSKNESHAAGEMEAFIESLE
jgi:tetratricopeptide (TPR) repeat protein